MGLTSRVGKICYSGHNKRQRSVGADSSSDEPVRGPSRPNMDLARAGSGLTALEPEGGSVPRRAAADSEVHRESDVDVDERYFGVGYRPNMAVTKVV